MTKEDILELLFDLKHDLGKYIRLPLAMLPSQADDTQVRRAVVQALRETRVSAHRVQSAAQIWQDFLTQIGEADGLKHGYAFFRLEKAVHNALKWERAIFDSSASAPLDRRVVQEDLNGVDQAIIDLIDEINNGP